MLISIKRVYLNGREPDEIIINTNSIERIEPTHEEDFNLPRTRIVMIPSRFDDGIKVMYTNEFISSIKSKYTKAINTRRKLEE